MNQIDSIVEIVMQLDYDGALSLPEICLLADVDYNGTSTVIMETLIAVDAVAKEKRASDETGRRCYHYWSTMDTNESDEDDDLNALDPWIDEIPF